MAKPRKKQAKKKPKGELSEVDLAKVTGGGSIIPLKVYPFFKRWSVPKYVDEDVY